MIDAIKKGDETAFEQAYITYRGKVYGYLLKKTRCHEDARDLLQVTFLKLWQYRRSLSSEYLPEQQIFHIARTVFIDHLRKKNRQPQVQEALEYNMPSNTQYSYISTEFDLRRRLGHALSDMPEVRKKIFELHRLQGFSYQEIAQQLSISVKSVDNNLAKALRHLRRTILLLAAAGFWS
jgi:RNA polymerase sigma factor (sigma-70 family)